MSTSNLSYRRCDYFSGRVDTPPCMNEGLYFCNLCGHAYCDSHLCLHLAAQFEHDNEGIAYESTTDSRVESISLHYQSEAITVTETQTEIFRESSEQQLRETPEIILRSHLARLMSEAKRVQRELERRMIYNAEMNGIKRHSPVLTYDQRKVLIEKRRASDEELSRVARQREREEKRQQKVKDALNILNNAIASGKVSKEQLINKVRKG